MLILTRRAGQTIVVGEAEVLHEAEDGLQVIPIAPIRIQVIEIKGKQVRLGIEAPRALPIHREEVWKRIQAEREAGRKCTQPNRT